MILRRLARAIADRLSCLNGRAGPDGETQAAIEWLREQERLSREATERARRLRRGGNPIEDAVFPPVPSPRRRRKRGPR